MWRPFKQLLPKEHSGPSGGLEGRTIDVGNVKVHVREAIAEGGFSCVYLARDMANPAKQYALKHVVVQDRESLDLVQKEVTVMRSLKGHPNVVTLVAHTVLDMGNGREAFLLMEFCERSLVSALESRGAGFFDEEKIALIFRDVCNAVFAMHCQTPPVAHRSAFHIPICEIVVIVFFTVSSSLSCIRFGAFVMNILRESHCFVG
jgi:AP2-associated kinase